MAAQSEADKFLRGLVIFAIIILALSLWSICRAESLRPATIQWNMEPTTDLAGFDLRINENNATMINIGANATAWTGSLMFLDGQNIIEVRSKDLAGQMSGWSDPAYHDPVPGKPHITVIVIQE